MKFFDLTCPSPHARGRSLPRICPFRPNSKQSIRKSNQALAKSALSFRKIDLTFLNSPFDPTKGIFTPGSGSGMVEVFQGSYAAS